MVEQSTLDRFWAKVDKSGECWLWTGALLQKGGYGAFRLWPSTVRAHRFSYELAKGSIPEGLELDHLCRVHACVNSDHLEAVTRRENLLRGNGPSGINARKTHCPQGHEYNSENTSYSPAGWRSCRECARIKKRTNKDSAKRVARLYAAGLTARGTTPKRRSAKAKVLHPDVCGDADSFKELQEAYDELTAAEAS